MTPELKATATELQSNLDLLQRLTSELTVYATNPVFVRQNREEVERKVTELDTVLDRNIEIIKNYPVLMAPSWGEYVKSSGMVIGTIKTILLLI